MHPVPPAAALRHAAAQRRAQREHEDAHAQLRLDRGRGLPAARRAGAAARAARRPGGRLHGDGAGRRRHGPLRGRHGGLLPLRRVPQRVPPDREVPGPEPKPKALRVPDFPRRPRGEHRPVPQAGALGRGEQGLLRALRREAHRQEGLPAHAAAAAADRATQALRLRLHDHGARQAQQPLRLPRGPRPQRLRQQRPAAGGGDRRRRRQRRRWRRRRGGGRCSGEGHG
mmetsp:Transcript_40369/g.126304  ORF Transcript_40369/g.126304 Transcript_40369/m.126304 type:complete len:227 (-) Transcript_40369:108-788(-)